jgi:hypothetical protein
MKAKLANAALLTASIVFSLLILEVSLRAFHNEWGYINFRDRDALFENKSPATFDSELGWLPKQGVWSAFAPGTQITEPGAVVTILEDGIRSNGSGQVVNTTESILAVGDSFTFGSQVSCVDDPVEARAIWYVRRGRVRSCVRPTLRGLVTAGPDAIRSLAPKQIYALEWRITLDGFFQAPGSTGSPSRHHRPHSPISCGNR